MEKINIGGIENDIDRETARRAFYNTSFSAERRGDSVVEDYIREMKSLAEYISGAAQDERQKAVMQEVFDSLRARYREKTRAWLSAQSKCMSAFITGPAKFPVRRAEKANDAEHKRALELLEFSKNMRGYAGKALDRVFTTEEKQADAIEAMAAQTPQEGQKLHGLEIIRNRAEDRLQLIFEGKPNEAVRGLLKSHGFKWSPRFSAWQRQLTANAEAVLSGRILKSAAMASYISA